MILDEIIAHKREEVIAARSRVDLRHLQDLLLDAPAPRPFAQALRRSDGRTGLIAEIKKASPSAGVISQDFDPVRQAKAYETAGADCLSVLSDERFFQGHLDHLRAVRHAVALPILRKDFTVDTYQIVEARAAGADAVLLIAAVLSPTQIKDFAQLTHELGMAALVEVHTAAEMEIAIGADAKLIGINSRNLKTFAVDLGAIEELSTLIPAGAGITLVGESGIKKRADVDRLRAAGISAILVGETLMRASNIAAALSDLLG